MKKITTTIILGIFLLSCVSAAFDLTFSSDSKLTEIYTSSLCAISIKCDENTPTEIDVDFEKDSKTGVIKVDATGIGRNNIK